MKSLHNSLAWHGRVRRRRALAGIAFVIVSCTTLTGPVRAQDAGTCLESVELWSGNTSISTALSEYFQASQAAAANLKAQCAAANGYYCDAGGTLSLTWTPENMAQAATIMGTVSLCFPPGCCSGYSCDSTDGLQGWVGAAFVDEAMSRFCALNGSVFCWQTGTLSLGLQQECQQAALGALAEEVGVLTGVSIMCIACFFLVCKRVRNRMRGQQDEPNDFLYVELEDAADADALEELREFVMEHRVFPYSSIEDKEKCGDTCAICLEGWKATDEVSLFEPCGHLFHAHCITEWMTQKDTCPVCRQQWEPVQP